MSKLVLIIYTTILTFSHFYIVKERSSTMNKLIYQCPACQEELRISSLSCPRCNIELKGSFELSPFDKLSEAQYHFLLVFLRHRGNLKNVQSELQISYPAAKKELDELLIELGLAVPNETTVEWEVPDMKSWFIDRNSTKASQIIKAKLIECGGRTIVHTITGLPCEIALSTDGESLLSNKLPLSPPYRLEVFDYIVELLLKNGGKAKKGNGRNYKLGDPNCDESTVVGYVAKHYMKKHDGDSVFDPVFVFAAILEWAEIAHNGRGEISLTASYRNLL